MTSSETVSLQSEARVPREDKGARAFARRSFSGDEVSRKLGWTPLFSGPFYGPSMLAAGIVLSVMILPFIVSVSRQVLLAVPNDQREGALALGATKWESTWKVVVPYAKRGIYGSVFLALA